MPSGTKSSPKPAYNQTAEPSDQISFIYGNQYNQYSRVNQYPPLGGVSYPGNQYQPHNNVQDQAITSGATQHGVMPIVGHADPPHEDYMVFAVLSCLLCFWPTGLCAIIAACKANNAAAEGDVKEAQRQSRKAHIYATAAVIVEICLILMYGASLVIYYSSYF